MATLNHARIAPLNDDSLSSHNSSSIIKGPHASISPSQQQHHHHRQSHRPSRHSTRGKRTSSRHRRSSSASKSSRDSFDSRNGHHHQGRHRHSHQLQHFPVATTLAPLPYFSLPFVATTPAPPAPHHQHQHSAVAPPPPTSNFFSSPQQLALANHAPSQAELTRNQNIMVLLIDPVTRQFGLGCRHCGSPLDPSILNSWMATSSSSISSSSQPLITAPFSTQIQSSADRARSPGTRSVSNTSKVSSSTRRSSPGLAHAPSSAPCTCSACAPGINYSSRAVAGGTGRKEVIAAPSPDATPLGQAVAKATWTGSAKHGFLPVQKGDLISVLKIVDARWMYAVHSVTEPDGSPRKGLVRADVITMISASAVAVSPPATSNLIVDPAATHGAIDSSRSQALDSFERTASNPPSPAKSRPSRRSKSRSSSAKKKPASPAPPSPAKAHIAPKPSAPPVDPPMPPISVVFDFTPTFDGALSVKKGESVKLLSVPKDGWAVLEKTPSGESGLVPMNCLKFVS